MTLQTHKRLSYGLTFFAIGIFISSSLLAAFALKVKEHKLAFITTLFVVSLFVLIGASIGHTKSTKKEISSLERDSIKRSIPDTKWLIKEILSESAICHFTHKDKPYFKGGHFFTEKDFNEIKKITFKEISFSIENLATSDKITLEHIITGAVILHSLVPYDVESIENFSIKKISEKVTGNYANYVIFAYLLEQYCYDEKSSKIISTLSLKEALYKLAVSSGKNDITSQIFDTIDRFDEITKKHFINVPKNQRVINRSGALDAMSERIVANKQGIETYHQEDADNPSEFSNQQIPSDELIVENNSLIHNKTIEAVYKLNAVLFSLTKVHRNGMNEVIGKARDTISEVNTILNTFVEKFSQNNFSNIIEAANDFTQQFPKIQKSLDQENKKCISSPDYNTYDIRRIIQMARNDMMEITASIDFCYQQCQSQQKDYDPPNTMVSETKSIPHALNINEPTLE